MSNTFDDLMDAIEMATVRGELNNLAAEVIANGISGSITPDEAKELHDRIQDVRSLLTEKEEEEGIAN